MTSKKQDPLLLLLLFAVLIRARKRRYKKMHSLFRTGVNAESESSLSEGQSQERPQSGLCRSILLAQLLPLQRLLRSSPGRINRIGSCDKKDRLLWRHLHNAQNISRWSLRVKSQEIRMHEKVRSK